MKNRGVLTIISGFSGVGKGTLVKALLDKYDNYALSVSATTRAPRPGEIEGINYFFIRKEEFEEKIQNDAFLNMPDMWIIITAHPGNMWNGS